MQYKDFYTPEEFQIFWNKLEDLGIKLNIPEELFLSLKAETDPRRNFIQWLLKQEQENNEFAPKNLKAIEMAIGFSLEDEFLGYRAYIRFISKNNKEYTL